MIGRGVIVVVLLLSGRLGFAQIDRETSQYGSVHVTVRDADSGQPIPFANVYINGTTIGGYANDHGEAIIAKVPIGTHELVITSVSHKPSQRKLVVKGGHSVYMTVELRARVLNEVEVHAKADKKWHRQLARFQRLFFGSQHFRECKISNPWVLDFRTSRGDFIAEATAPLKIENNYLGYDLEFDIKACVFNSSKTIITGFVHFQEKPANDSTSARWAKNRHEMYRGSPQHFLRAVIDNSLDREGYNTYLDRTKDADIIRGSHFSYNLGASIEEDSIATRVRQSNDGTYAIDFPSRLEIHYMHRHAKISVYRDVTHPISWMEVKKGTLNVSRDGFVQEPDALTVIGAMSNLKVAEWLPRDYYYSGTNVNDSPTKPSDKLVLLEKPYVQTDRNYYYNNETLWLKGYMSYTVPVLKDTLSQTIYVELADSAGNLVVTKRYRVEEGIFHGDILFGRNWKPGPYQLKVYTAWMLNFDTRMIFTKTITLLGEKEGVRMVSNYMPPTDTLPNIFMRADKSSYSPREKITVNIDVTDSLDFPIASQLSISVTDINQAVPQKNEKTILTNFLYNEIPNETTTKTEHDIEYGIAFNGNFLLGKKPVLGSISVFQDNGTEPFGIITDDVGRFKQSLLFNDTVNFYVSALSANNKKGRVVMDTLRPHCPQLDLEPAGLDVYSSDLVRHTSGMNLSGVNVLQEVSVKASRIDKPRSPAVIHGQGDYQVTGEWLDEHNSNDVLLALAMRVPGIYYDPTIPALTMRTGFTSYGRSAGGPLLMVDGIQVTLEQIRDIPIRSIDFVDVLKFSSAVSYGSRGANGVIAIYTKKWKPRDPDDKSFDKRNLQEITWSGFSTPSVFPEIDHSKSSDNEYFDYRSTIYWSPDIKTNGKDPATVSFYAGDAGTRYRIVVEGVTANGTPVRAEKIIEIANGR